VNAPSKWAIGVLVPLALANCERAPLGRWIGSASDLTEAMSSALGSTCRFEPSFGAGFGGCRCAHPSATASLDELPSCDPPPAAGSELFLQLVSLAPAVRRFASGEDADALRARALWALVWSDSEEAALSARGLLGRAHETEPDGPGRLSDLLAGTIVLASRTRDARELFRAFDLALELDSKPVDGPARANVELASTLFFEARDRAESPERRDSSCDLRRDAADRALFVDWAEAARAADRDACRRSLDRIRAAATALKDECGDRFWLDVWIVMERYGNSCSADLAADFADLRGASAAYARYDLQDAKVLLRRVLRATEFRARPLNLEARLLASATDFQLGNVQDARRWLVEMRRRELADYPSILGRWQWQLGTLAVWNGNQLGSLTAYREAIEAYESGRSWRDAAAVSGLLAETALRMGDVEGAAQAAVRSVRAVGLVTDPRRKMTVLHAVAGVFEAMGLWRGAAHFASAAVDAIRPAGQPMALAWGLLVEARYLSKLGHERRAAACLDEVEGILASKTDAAATKLLLADTQLEIAHRGGSAERVHQALDSAEAIYAEHGLTRGVTLAKLRRLELRAVGAQTTTRRERAEIAERVHDLYLALDIDDRLRSAPDRRQVTELLIRSSLAEGRFIEALALDQWDRMWMLTSRPARPAAIERWLERMESRPSNAETPSIFVFRSLGDRVVRWRLMPHGWSADSLSRSPEHLEEETDGLRSALRAGWINEARGRAERIGDLLFGSNSEAAKSGTEILLVADADLWRIPYLFVLESEDRAVAGSRALRLALVLRVHSDGTEARLNAVARAGAAIVGYPEVHPDDPFPMLDRQRTELWAMRERFGPDLGEAIGRHATIDRAVHALEGHALIHFATHVIEGGPRGENAAILLSRADKKQRHLLDASVIRNLNLSGTQLVFLAGCKSALGAPSRIGEEAGLATSFLQAGASQVTGTLWEIDDGVAAELSAWFYGRRDWSRTVLRSSDLRGVFEASETRGANGNRADFFAIQSVHRQAFEVEAVR
jgi:hypothetical protein